MRCILLPNVKTILESYSSWMIVERMIKMYPNDFNGNPQETHHIYEHIVDTMRFINPREDDHKCICVLGKNLDEFDEDAKESYDALVYRIDELFKVNLPKWKIAYLRFLLILKNAWVRTKLFVMYHMRLLNGKNANQIYISLKTNIPSSYAIDFADKDEVLAYYVDEEDYSNYDILLAIILYEITWHGFDEDAKDELIKSFSERVRNIESIDPNSEEGKKHFVQIDDQLDKYLLEISPDEAYRDALQTCVARVFNIRNELNVMERILPKVKKIFASK